MARFVRVYESADLDALVAMLTDDVFMSMPPIALEYEGRDAVASFLARILRPGRRFDLVATRANGQPAFGAYLRQPDGTSVGNGMFVDRHSGRAGVGPDPLREPRVPVVRAARVAARGALIVLIASAISAQERSVAAV